METSSDKPLQEQERGTGRPLDTLHEEYVSTSYPHVHKNLKLKSEDEKLNIEPDSSTGTLASYTNLDTFDE